MPPRNLEAVRTVVKISDASETFKNIPDAYGTTVKLSDAYGKIVIDVRWDQDDPNYKNRHDGAFPCNSG